MDSRFGPRRLVRRFIAAYSIEFIQGESIHDYPGIL